MKMDIQSMNDQAIKDTTSSRKMKLSENASSMVFKLFTKSIYSNPIGTVVREITSNCFDSHVEAGVDVPVLIRKNKEADGKFSISFIDFGVGMSPERVYDIYGTYFESTKRVDNTQIGGFGIGGKTPLAYKRSTGMGEGEYDNSFNVITRFDGMEYTYLIYEGSESPVISKLFEQETSERNGTEVRVPVLESDMNTFIKEMTEQLYYFENIVFEGFDRKNEWSGEIESPISNDYQIIRGKTFLFRGDAYNSSMHVCLGKVAYPINYNVLGLSESDYHLPIALRLEVGDIHMTAAREQLDYSEGTIKLLKKKLEEAKNEIIALIGKQYKNIKTLREYFEVKNNFGHLKFKNGASLYVGNLIEQKDVDFSNFKYSFLKMPNDKQLFKFFFEPKMYGKKPRQSRYGTNNNEFVGSYNSLQEKGNLLYVEDEFNRKIVKQAWLKETYETYYIIHKRGIAFDWVKSDIADLFNVHLDDVRDANNKPVAFVQSLIDMQEEYMELVREFCFDYETLEVPEDFVASRKRNAGITPELRKTSIPVKFIGSSYGKQRIMLSALFDYQMPIFYGTQDDSWALSEAMHMFKLLFNQRAVVTHYHNTDGMKCGRRYDTYDGKASIAFIQIAQGNVKHMQYCKNAMHVNMFKLKMMNRKEETVRQYFQMREAIEKYKEIGNFYRRGFIDKISADWGKKMDEINMFLDAMPQQAKNDSLQYRKSDLSRYYTLDNIEQTPEQKAVIQKIEGVLELQEKNEKALGYFRIPDSPEDFDNEQIALLELAMTL